MSFPIPKSFMLHGTKISVEYDPALHHNDDVHGWARYRQSKIVLQPNTEAAPLTAEMVEHNFLHEMVHHLLYAAGEDSFDPPLHKREYLVDRIAGLLHQALTTMQY